MNIDRTSATAAHLGARRSARTRGAHLAWLAVIGLGLGACSSGTEAAGSDDTVPAETDPVAALLLDSTDGAFVAVETELVDCMAEHGFRYEPVMSDLSATDAIPTAERVATYGYGIFTEPPASATDVDPNTAIRDGLSPQERDAYDLAFAGPSTGGQGPSPDSCMGRADARLNEISELLFDPAVQAIVEEYRTAIDADERVVAAEAGWRDCMADSGYTHPDRLAITAYLTDKLDTITEAELPAARAEELQLAAADFSCSAEADAVREQVQAELGAAFVDRLAPLLVE